MAWKNPSLCNAFLLLYNLTSELTAPFQDGPTWEGRGTQQLLKRCISTPVNSVLLEVNNIIFLWFYKTKKKKKNPDVSDTKAERNIFQNVCEIKMYKHWYLRTGRLQMCWPEECWMKISGMLERRFTFIARKCVLLASFQKVSCKPSPAWSR